MTTSTEYAENVCRGLDLPIRGVAFVYIENAIAAALDLQAEKFNARIVELFGRDLTRALVNDDAATPATLTPTWLEAARDALVAAAVKFRNIGLSDGGYAYNEFNAVVDAYLAAHPERQP